MCHALETMLCRVSRGLALALLLPSSGVASDPPEPRAAFSDRLDLVQVEVDLVVTDRKGRPVLDLDRGEVELFRDGARQELLYFDGPAAVTADAESAGRSRHIVVYVDNLRIWPKRRNTLLRRLASFIEYRIARGDRFSIVAFDGSTIEPVVVDSRDFEQIAASLEALESRPSAMVETAAAAHRLRRDLAGGAGMAGLEPRIERYVERLQLDVARSVVGLAKTIRVFARPAAPTSVLYLSDGIPAWPGGELSSLGAAGSHARTLIGIRTAVEEGLGVDGVPTPTVQYLVSLPSSLPGTPPADEPEGTVSFLEPLIRVANAHGVDLYPVRPSALLHPSLLDSRAGAIDPVGPLRRMAESTGGDLVSYGRFEDALAGLSRRLDSAYTLGFQIVQEDEPTSHTLEVQLTRKGLEAHYRRAFASEPRAARPPEEQGRPPAEDGT